MPLQVSGQITLEQATTYWNTKSPGIGALNDLQWYSGRAYFTSGGPTSGLFPAACHLEMFYNTSPVDETPAGGGGGGK